MKASFLLVFETFLHGYICKIHGIYDWFHLGDERVWVCCVPIGQHCCHLREDEIYADDCDDNHDDLYGKCIGWMVIALVVWWLQTFLSLLFFAFTSAWNTKWTMKYFWKMRQNRKYPYLSPWHLFRQGQQPDFYPCPHRRLRRSSENNVEQRCTYWSNSLSFLVQLLGLHAKFF